ncbi:MAG: ABC transporter permease [Parvibaculaceae bacterium]
MTLVERSSLIMTWCVTGAVVVFLLTPLAVTIVVSFSSSSIFTLPPPEWSLQWYRRLAGYQGLLPALLLSLQVAAVSTAVSLFLGTLCAIGIRRGQFAGREIVTAFMVSPLMMPQLVIGVALLQYFRALGLGDPYGSLLIAHVIITMPFVVRIVLAALALFDFDMIDAARTLGYSHVRAHIKVTVPVLAPAFLTASLFAFLASMDNYPISIFFTDAWTKTLPIQMLQYIEETPDPTIAAISSLLILLTAVVLIVADRLVGLRRLGDF